jgi:hypothetical protein
MRVLFPISPTAAAAAAAAAAAFAPMLDNAF